MRYILPDGKLVQGDGPLILNGTQYPSGIRGMSVDERKALGITEVIEQPYPQGDFQFVNEDPDKPGSWIVTPYPAERITAELIAYARECRWKKEQGGLKVSGVLVDTDDRSKLMLMGAKQMADANANYTTQWALEDGSSVALSAAQIQGIALTVSSFVDGCFKTYATVVADIKAGTIKDKAGVAAAFV